jgi:outer membrane protein assembly factor BamB
LLLLVPTFLLADDYYVDKLSGIPMCVEPSQKAKLIMVVQHMSNLEVLSYNGPVDTIESKKARWYKVTIDGIKGWVFSGFLAFNLDTSAQGYFYEIPSKQLGIMGTEKKLIAITIKTKLASIIGRSIVDNIKAPGNVSYLSFAFVGNKLVICLSLDDGGSFTSFFMALDKKTGKFLWKRGFGGFNVAKPLCHNKSIYFSGSGFIGKLDTRTGKLSWYHHDLYRNNNRLKSNFNTFISTYIKKGSVYFVEGSKQSHLGKRRVIRVDDKSGKIERIIYLDQ